MSQNEYDLVILGAGSGGLTAARFAARLGARVALVEKHRIGGDCTWTGCIPSKALLKAAKVAHEVRTSAIYGIDTGPPAVDMERVREYVRSAIEQVYRLETPEEIQSQGIEVIFGAARFQSPESIAVGDRSIRAKAFLITTGARPVLPAITGIGQGAGDVPFLTYEQIFEIDRLPEKMVVVGSGPIGMELGQAYQRLGSKVSIIADQVLPREEPEVREVIERVFAREGIRMVAGRAVSAHRVGRGIAVATAQEEVVGDLLLIAAGRKPAVEGLDLEKAGVEYSERGIPVNRELHTNVKHIYAAGDVTGGHQFTHFAGWQAFQAARNALLPGSSSGLTDLVPRVTFTDPEVAHAGLTEAQARGKFGDAVQVHRWNSDRTDRAICENDTDGFLKLVTQNDGTILGATIVAGRAGEAITELLIAIRQGWKAGDLAGAIHPYPTYSTAVQQVTAEIAVDALLSGPTGRFLRGLSKLIR